MAGVRALDYQVLTNLDCNLRCSYCYEARKGRGRNDAGAVMDFLEAMYRRDWGPQARDRDEGRLVVLDCIGGETLLYPDLLDAMCTKACELQRRYKVRRPFRISVTTNGTQFGREDVRAFVRKWRNVLSVGLSIDGVRDVHDACRVDAAGRGTYDRAIEGYEWLRGVVRPEFIGVKGTFCHATMDRWGEGVKNLIDLGFREIACNVVFEEVWSLEDGVSLARQMMDVADYLVGRGAEKQVRIFQLNGAFPEFERYGPPFFRRERNHCGSCTFMRCLGFDRMVYGCNRFCTMKNPVPIGHLEGQEVVIDDQRFVDEVAGQWRRWPKVCMECALLSQCPSCSAIPYEADGVEAFYERRPMCGFTHAIALARMYLAERLRRAKQ